MRLRAASVALLLVAGCHRAPVGDAPDAEADLRARTAAKTSADLAAADAATRRPLPHVAPPPRSSDEIDRTSTRPVAKDDDAATATANGADEGMG